MFGKNPIRKRDNSDGSTLWVQEVFYTIQGEGPEAGRPSVFVRLAGCNLACFFCDTDFESSSWRPTVAELVAKVQESAAGRTKLVVLTGGEPLRQTLSPLLLALFRAGFAVQIETSGTLWQPVLGVYIDHDEPLTIVCSPKTGRLASGFRAHAFKYIVGARAGLDPVDGLPVLSTQQEGRPLRIARPPESLLLAHRVYVQPMDEYDAERNKQNMIYATDIALRHGYRLCVQVHKIAGVP
jgi:organic radical activating enzyme